MTDNTPAHGSISRISAGELELMTEEQRRAVIETQGDEIERLRADWHTERYTRQQHEQTISQLNDKIERLRKIVAIEGSSCEVIADIKRQSAEIDRLQALNDELLAAMQMVVKVVLRECLELHFSNAEITQMSAAIAKATPREYIASLDLP
jgi:TolA-binding protein